MKIPDFHMHTDHLIMQFAGFDPVVVNPLRGQIRMTGRYATDWPETEAGLIVEFVSASLPDSMWRMGEGSDGTWWIYDDAELPKRPGMAVAMNMG